MAVQTDRGIPLSALNPKFLHTNSTSHTWPFSAIAELIDNAYDPDVSAKQFWIDKTVIGGESCLVFMDNGGGMDKDKMFKMLSFGFSDKQTINGHVPVGLYGNGFKSGSMRLGKDAIVFSKNKDSMCVGMLSQTYLEEIGAENVIVPIASFQRYRQTIVPDPKDAASLEDILRYSLFKTQAELLSEVIAINSHYASESTGTRIIIWNLRKTSTGNPEFDFDTDRYDIRIPSEVYESEREMYKQPCRTFQSSPESDYSLRAYCSILYLKPKMLIVIRGQKVKTQLISKSLAHRVKDKYTPSFLNKESISITFGYNTKSKEHYGVMMYHKNRLIKSYERVGCQNRANEKGVGVIAVIECNFLKPTHNKQDFDYTEEYRRTMNTLGVKLEEYWKAIRHKKGSQSTIPMEDLPKRPDQNWVQCDACQKWRKLQDGIDMNKLPDNWFCRMNPDPEFRRCEDKEEVEDSEDETSSCLKTYKQHERNIKRQQEQKRMQAEESRLHMEKQRNAAQVQQIENLKRLNSDLVRQYHQKSPSSPQSPSVPWTAANSACSPSDNMPVISSVVSLSTSKRTKRDLGLSQNQGTKKARMEVEASASTLVIQDDSDSSTEISDDDDIVIDEINSTPKPPASTFDLSKVKTEKSSNIVQKLFTENNDHISMETEASTSDAQISTTTQTEPPTIKSEDKESQKEMEIKKEVLESDERRMEQTTKELENGTTQKLLNKDSEVAKKSGNAGLSSPRSANTDAVPFEGNNTAEQHQEGVTSQEIVLSDAEAQKQQDKLLKLLEATAMERDKYREQFLEKEIQLLNFNVKDQSHLSTQTDPSEDYRTLYLQAQQSIQKLTKERDEALLQIKDAKVAPSAGLESEGHCSIASASEINNDEMALQVDFLLGELDKHNVKCAELESKLESLNREKACFEQLQVEVAELRKQREQWTKKNGETETCNSSLVPTGSTSTAPIILNGIKKEDNNEEGSTAKLRELRSNVARLLVTFVPALDPEQVNCDCDVIDEILNQVLQEIDPNKHMFT
ncbi:hypothetical protein DNTS_026888 [Danionella cerebrum]|uniref:CW-type domain-containing protein n=1 Tax=Danionella cerebrum TaxID=2873325 RepID=A0A553QE36_9TELE|nr:hypothetical protein DNTS_026888 [Danionella translucida]